jgi:hypothetical protein
MANENEQIRDLLSRIGPNASNVVTLEHGVDPSREHKTVTVKLESPPLIPIRAESPARHHTFQTGLALRDYLERYKTDHTIVYSDPAGCQAAAVLDESAKEGFEVVHLVPVTHPLFEPWATVLARKNEEGAADLRSTILTLEQFSQLVADSLTIIETPNARELAFTLRQIQVSTKIERQIGTGTKSLNGLMVETAIQGRSTTEPIDMPEFVELQVPVFYGAASVTIRVDLGFAVKEGTVTVRLSSASVKEAMLKAFDAFVAQVSDIENLLVVNGKLSYCPRAYIR